MGETGSLRTTLERKKGTTFYEEKPSEATRFSWTRKKLDAGKKNHELHSSGVNTDGRLRGQQSQPWFVLLILTLFLFGFLDCYSSTTRVPELFPEAIFRTPNLSLPRKKRLTPNEACLYKVHVIWMLRNWKLFRSLDISLALKFSWDVFSAFWRFEPLVISAKVLVLVTTFEYLLLGRDWKLFLEAIYLKVSKPRSPKLSNVSSMVTSLKQLCEPNIIVDRINSQLSAGTSLTDSFLAKLNAGIKSRHLLLKNRVVKGWIVKLEKTLQNTCCQPTLLRSVNEVE